MIHAQVAMLNCWLVVPIKRRTRFAWNEAIVRIKMYGETDVGRVRSKNQDSFYFNEVQGLCVVCDGIGGRKGGETASSIAVEGIRKAFLDCDALRAEEAGPFLMVSIDQVNQKIILKGLQERKIQGMGTTINCLLFVGEMVYMAHIGDSRTYLLKDNHIWQLTIDHNIEVYVERGWLPPEVLQSSAKPGALVRALGLSNRCEADIYEKKVSGGEIYLTCSDGLTGMVSDKKIKEIITQNRNRLEVVPKILVAEANRSGGRDNTTVVITEILED